MVEGLSSETGVVLVVDDDPDVLVAARILLERNGQRVVTAGGLSAAWSLVAEQPVDVILLDLNFTRGATSGAEGFGWLAEIRSHDPDAVVVVVTAHSGVNVAVAAMKAGASDFVMKPWNNARLLETVHAAQALRRQRRAAAGPAIVDDDLLVLGESPAIGRIRELMTLAAPTAASVLVRGEPGTGKSLVARGLHARSRRHGRLVTVDARALGAEAGVVTQAAEDALGGSLLLDEIAALPGAGQAELLAVLDSARDVRLISTTAQPRLESLRPDLAARLATVEIALPTLAERDGDLVLLAEHFVRLFARRYGRAWRPLDAAVAVELRAQPPLGEVRGLRQAAERAVVLAGDRALVAADFAPAAMAELTAPRKADLNLARSERTIIEAALRRHAHNVSQAARELGLTRAALYRRMVKHDL